MSRRFIFLATLPFLLAACEQVNELLGLEDQVKKEARLEADGKAVGSGCRQSGRAIEDCYAIYSWLPRAAVFAGWREMDTYMRENNIDTVEPLLPPVEPPGTKKKRATSESDGEEKSGKTTKTATPKSEAKKSAEEDGTDKPEGKKPEVKQPEKAADKPPPSEEKKPTPAKAKSGT